MKKRYWILGGCLVLFILLLVLIVTNQIEGFDNLVYQGIFINHPFWNEFYKYFTHIGSTVSVIVITIVLFFVLRKKKDKIMLLSSVAITVAMNQIIKHIVLRPRPPLERRLIQKGGYSFPSGHAMISMCLCGLFIYFCATRIKNKTTRIICITLLCILMLMIGISRIYLGVHYPSDIIGGYLLSLAILIGDITFVNHHFKGE